MSITPTSIPHSLVHEPKSAETIQDRNCLTWLNINVNCIATGFIKTELVQTAMHWTDEDVLQRTKSFPIARAGLPEDIAYAAVFLASESANFITGQTLSVDGGSSLSREGG